MPTIQADQSDGDLAFVAARLAAATSTRDVFGEIHGTPDEQLDQVHRTYRRLALSVHPDRHQNDPAAHAAFVALQRLYSAAQRQVSAGRYGEPATPASSVVISTRRRTYTVGEPFAVGALANLYACTMTDGRSHTDGILKIARDPLDNDLLVNEARILRHLAVAADGTPAPAYIPKLLETFVFQDAAGQAHQVNAFPLLTTEQGPLPADQFSTLTEIREAYPDGVDPKQMAWMWRRLLIALGHAHDREVIHGAVLPTHILIHPEAHGLLLVDWSSSVLDARLNGAHVPSISAEYESWYPSTVLARAPATPAVDLAMALRCMVYLLGGDPLTGSLPPGVPAPLQTYLRGALRIGTAQTDAWQLYRDFADLLADLWGKRTFMPFAMPARR